MWDTHNSTNGTVKTHDSVTTHDIVTTHDSVTPMIVWQVDKP